jgi:hypothetical protein
MNSGKNKEIMLAALLAVIALYAFATLLLWPERVEAERLRGELELSEQRIRAGSSQLKGLNAKELASRAEADMDAWTRELLETMPNPYLVNAPPLILQMLREHDLKDPHVSLLLVLPFRSMPDYALAGWEVRIEEARALSFGQALADLENRFPLGQLTSLSLQANPGRSSVSASMVFQTAVHP